MELLCRMKFFDLSMAPPNHKYTNAEHPTSDNCKCPNAIKFALLFSQIVISFCWVYAELSISQYCFIVLNFHFIATLHVIYYYWNLLIQILVVLCVHTVHFSDVVNGKVCRSWFKDEKSNKVRKGGGIIRQIAVHIPERYSVILSEVCPWTDASFRLCTVTETASDLDAFVLWLRKNAGYDEIA